MFENIKVIVSDIDGTLCAAGEKPSKETIETIEELRKRGYLFGLASGRPADDLVKKCKDWGVSSQYDFIIGWNGCELLDFSDDSFYQFNKLKKEWLKEIVDLISQYPVNIHMYLPGRYIASNDTDKAWYSAYKNSREYTVADDYSIFYQDDNCGIMFRYDVKDDQMIRDALKVFEGRDFIYFNTQKDLMEFSHKDSNKGYALKKYCEKHQISLDDVLAFGDTDNDNEMLRICHGVCLKDGNENTKKLCEYVTDKICVEDGFADFIKRYLL